MGSTWGQHRLNVSSIQHGANVPHRPNGAPHLANLGPRCGILTILRPLAKLHSSNLHPRTKATLQVRVVVAKRPEYALVVSYCMF